MQPKLWSLTLGNFAIGAGVMIVPGMLNELSADLSVPPASIGFIISAFAMTICVGGPFLASLTSAIERRKLLVASLLLYAAMHFVSALAPGYQLLLLARVVTAIGAALFTAQAAATAGLMVAPEVRGKAIGFVFLGWSIAAVLGTPLGAYLGAHLGWRPTMALVGLLSLVSAFAVWRQIPSKLFIAPIDRAAWGALFSDAPLLLAISVTAIQALGMFTMFSYMALVLKDSIGATPTIISLMFLCFGVTGVIGNVFGARLMDKAGPVRVGCAAMGCMFIAILSWPISRGSLPLTALLTLVWGLGCFAVNGSQQARLVGMAPRLASASVAMNSSAIYLGQAMGAFIGGLIVSSQGTENLSWFGALPMGAAILVSQAAAAMAGRRTAEAA
ncbi:MFS transporter [Noviherbaspirillum galbum]|uniref:MFS transporter n=1 Tax=Noviherbaspirillum galbum TaxID=2709383 RepID=A0A6B3SSA5_9BURK|nr:MFS transporter [Noviherbaspirillum galbum]NEX63574.1 MFS transporter [Noviherbaspirillum galbum]